MATRVERVQREVGEWREGWVREWEKGREREREAGVSGWTMLFSFGREREGNETLMVVFLGGFGIWQRAHQARMMKSSMKELDGRWRDFEQERVEFRRQLLLLDEEVVMHRRLLIGGIVLLVGRAFFFLSFLCLHFRSSLETMWADFVIDCLGLQVSLLLAFLVDRFGGSFEASQPALERVVLARQRGEEKLMRRRSGGTVKGSATGADFEDGGRRAREFQFNDTSSLSSCLTLL